MSRYTVVWTVDALDGLLSIWLSTPNRAGVTQAASQIDVLLGKDPMSLANSSQEGLFGANVYPLRVIYEISEQDRIVKVAFVRLLNS